MSRLTLRALAVSSSASTDLQRSSMSSVLVSGPFQPCSFSDNFFRIKDTSDEEYVVGRKVTTPRFGCTFRLTGFKKGMMPAPWDRAGGGSGKRSKLSKSPSDRPSGRDGGARHWRLGVDGPSQLFFSTASRRSSSLIDLRRFRAPRGGVCGQFRGGLGFLSFERTGFASAEKAGLGSRTGVRSARNGGGARLVDSRL